MTAIMIILIIWLIVSMAVICKFVVEQNEIERKNNSLERDLNHSANELSAVRTSLFRKEDEVARLKTELASERRVQQLWRERCNRAWAQGYISDIPMVGKSKENEDKEEEA